MGRVIARVGGLSRSHGRMVVQLLLLTALGCATASDKAASKAGTPPDTPVAKLVQSFEQARDAVRQDPENAELRYKLGNTLFDLLRYAEAKTEYEAAIRLDPGLGPAYTNLGLCLKRLGRLPEAADAYRHALAIDPNDVTTLRNLILVLETQGDFDKAIIEIERLVRIQPDDVRVQSQYANALFRVRRYKEAAQVFERVLRLDPGLPGDYYNLGLCYYCLEDWDAALTSWLAALAHDPRNASVNKGLATLYWKRGEYKQAWDAVVQCQAMGVPLEPDFIRNLQRDSGQDGPQ